MARFCGKVGFLIEHRTTAPGVRVPTVEERTYYGDITRIARQNTAGQSINDNLTLSMQVSIMADTFAYDNAFAIAYVEYSGSLWKVSSVDIQRPRLILTLGGVYNGVKN